MTGAAGAGRVIPEGRAAALAALLRQIKERAAAKRAREDHPENETAEGDAA
jgi:hypothetical protein